jgi:hypothetical protein
MSWINNTMQPNGAGLWQQNGFGTAESFGDGSFGSPNMTLGAGDGYRPTWWGGNEQGQSSPFAPGSSGSSDTTNGMLGQIMSMLQQMMGGLGIGNGSSAYGQQNAYPQQGPCGGQSWCGDQQGTPGRQGVTFQNATLSSTGDPHLALSGTADNAGGGTTNVNDHYDDMSSHRDLLSTNDFGDHFRVSTTATTPNANGVTYNQSATATMNHGRDSVTMGPGGAVSVIDNGQSTAIAAGQTLTLSGGETVTEATNGSVSIAEQNAAGESLTTTFTNNGSGVDVSATASGGVTLSGDLVRHATSAQ